MRASVTVDSYSSKRLQTFSIFFPSNFVISFSRCHYETMIWFCGNYFLPVAMFRVSKGGCKLLFATFLWFIKHKYETTRECMEFARLSRLLISSVPPIIKKPYREPSKVKWGREGNHVLHSYSVRINDSHWIIDRWIWKEMSSLWGSLTVITKRWTFSSHLNVKCRHGALAAKFLDRS